MSRLVNQSSVDESIAMLLQYEFSELTINDAAIALEILQEEEGYVHSCLHDDEVLARTLQEMEGNLHTSTSDDENLVRFLQQEDELYVDDTDEDIQYIPIQVNRSYIPQRDAPSTSRSFSYYNDGENLWSDHTHTRTSPTISTHSSHNPSLDENIDPIDMSFEQLNELEDSIGDVSKGLSEKRISRLPTHKYGSKTRNWWWQKKKKFIADDSQCSICLDEYGKGDKIITLPCKHIYHKDCISHWLRQNSVCCVCKAQV